MTSIPPAFSIAEVLDIAANHYGIHASAHLLVSERDQNFLIKLNRLSANDALRRIRTACALTG